MSATDEYEMVNGMFKLFGEEIIEEPATGTDREKLEYLIEVYTNRLREKIPKYRSLPDSLIPDGILDTLRKARKAYQ